ncbi:MAG: 3-hydroxyacyl-CoA dehydrogenase family protein [Haloferacaceae archaeon]
MTGSGGPASIHEVAVVGAGLMGHGIALTYALDGHPVRLHDAEEAALDAAPERVAGALETMVGAGVVTDDEADAALDRLAAVDDLAAAVADADLVTEAVTEDVDVKREVFGRLDDHAPPDAVLATNTSGLSIDGIAEPVADRSRVLGTHWFNPPYVVPLVEIVRGEATADDAVARVRDLLDAAGKEPVVVREDVPGFVGNRIQLAMTYEALSLLERGVASAADIDRAVKAGFGFRLPLMGVFEKLDQSGLDVHRDVESYLMPDLDRGTEPSGVLDDLLSAGHAGVKSGKGVYDWSDRSTEDVARERDRALFDMLALYEDAVDDPPPANYRPE